ncbi:DNA-binding transcription factor [Lithospermum erythrorhizon]|uniref:DNA-binding transcription factor n=1 Tax=Lithospermum erythrorhizon TaxID=34254 RepID=A0AAV3NX73_LITER
MSTSATGEPEPPAAAAAATTVTPPEKVTRKFPPPCWTQEETLALIEAYRDRWYALRRGYLRTADWDSVALAVTERCPGVSPPKTSAQCRHKMEKLRQRYRAEKQRSLAYPAGCFFSSWFFFENMDAMEHGTPLPAPGTNQEFKKEGILGSGHRLGGFLDQNLLKLKVNGKNVVKISDGLDPRLNFYGGKSDGKVSASYGVKVVNDGYNGCVDGGSDKEEEDEGGFGGEYGIANPVVDMKAKKFRSMFAGSQSGGGDIDHGGSNKGYDFGNGFNVRHLMTGEMLPPGLRAKRYGKVDQRGSPGFDGEGGENSGNGGFWGNRNAPPQGSRGRYGGNVDGSLDPRGMKGYSNGLSSSGAEKAKRARDPLEDMVMSIKMLGEGFVKMEKMKMDMARDMEKMRMEMEIKRNELILESQKQIMDAFVKGLLELKNKKVKTTAASPE